MRDFLTYSTTLSVVLSIGRDGLDCDFKQPIYKRVARIGFRLTLAIPQQFY